MVAWDGRGSAGGPCAARVCTDRVGALLRRGHVGGKLHGRGTEEQHQNTVQAPWRTARDRSPPAMQRRGGRLSSRPSPRSPLPRPPPRHGGRVQGRVIFPAQVGGRDSSLPSQTLGTAALTPSCCLLFMTSLRTSPEASPPSVTLPTAVVRQWDARRGAIRQVSSLGSLPAAAHNHPARQPGTAGRGGRVHAMKTQGLGSMLRKHCQPHPSVISVTHVNHAAAVRL